MATNIPYQLGRHDSGYVTPEVKASEGFNSVGKFYPAPWLPLVRYNEELRADVVISRGKPVAFAGSFLVPAGLKLELEAVKADPATATIKYTTEDVKKGVKNSAGVLATVGEAVVASLIAQDVDVSYFVGIANYDYFRHAGGDGWTPTTFDKYNYRPQSSVSFNMDYHYEFPLVASDADYAAAPYTGISAFIGADVKPGQFVTYNKDSNLVLAATDFSQGTKPEAVIGQVTIVHILKDKVTKEVLESISELHRVITPENISGNPLDQLPGSANGGMTQKVEYANAIGLVHVGLQTR